MAAALATLLEAVGEVPDDTAVTLERLLQPYVTSASSATRQQAAVALASLAAAHPAAAARMLSGCLDTVASCAGQMAAPLSPVAAASNLSAASADANGGLPHVSRSPSSSAGGAAGVAAAVSSPRPGTPAGGGAAAGGGAPRGGLSQRALMDTCHGAALAASRLLLTAAHAPLGCPARLQRRALALAEDLVTGPGPDVAANRCGVTSTLSCSYKHVSHNPPLFQPSLQPPCLRPDHVAAPAHMHARACAPPRVPPPSKQQGYLPRGGLPASGLAVRAGRAAGRPRP